jgi:hypothetical protein
MPLKTSKANTMIVSYSAGVVNILQRDEQFAAFLNKNIFFYFEETSAYHNEAL